MIEVGSLGDFSDDSCRVVEVGGREIGVIMWKGEIYALDNRCPHQAGPACGGRLGAFIDAEPGIPRVEGGRPTVACAWHGWEFDVRTGASARGGVYRLRSYPVSVRDDKVFVDLKSRQPRGS